MAESKVSVGSMRYVYGEKCNNLLATAEGLFMRFVTQYKLMAVTLSACASQCIQAASRYVQGTFAAQTLQAFKQVVVDKQVLCSMNANMS